MKALVFDGRKVRLEERARPQVPAGECLIRVCYSGICNTDLEILKGYMGFVGVLGHEFVGIVEACPDAEWQGARVVGEINCGCGKCEYCLQGLGRHCPNRTVLGILGRDGAHAGYLSLPVGNLHRVPEAVPDREAVFVEPLAAALEILEQVPLRPGAGVCVIGDGKLGQLIARVLRLHGADLTVLGRHPEKRRLLARLGIPALSPEEAGELPKQDVVVEASGNPDGLRLAGRLLRPRGILVLKSTYAQNLPFNPAPWVIDEITVVGSRCGPFAPALRLLAQKLVPVEDLISREFSAEEALEALDYAGNPGALKTLIRWS